MITSVICFLFNVIPLAVVAETQKSMTEDWHDTSRNRTIPVRLFLPGEKFQAEKCPVMLLSHGLGGSRDGFGYLGDEWSRSGYVVIVMQHPGSDETLWRNRKSDETVQQAMIRGITAKNANLRVGDVRFVLDELEKRNKKSSGSVLENRLDLTRVGIGGHSFGARTTMAVIGNVPQTRDSRLKVAIVMSPAPNNHDVPGVTFRNITIPTLFLTGTDDNSPFDANLKPEDRLIPFREATGKDQYLVVFDKGNHRLFSGHNRPLGRNALEKRYQPMIQEITLKFIDAHLKDSADAKKWLHGEGLEKLMRDNGTLERRQ